MISPGTGALLNELLMFKARAIRKTEKVVQAKTLVADLYRAGAIDRNRAEALSARIHRLEERIQW